MKKYTIPLLLIIMCTITLFACSQEESGKSNHDAQEVEKVGDKDKAEDNNINKEKDTHKKDNEDALTDDRNEWDQLVEEATVVNKAFNSFSSETTKDTVEKYGGEKNHLLAMEEKDVNFEPFKIKTLIKQEQLDDSDQMAEDFYSQTGEIYISNGMSYIYLGDDTWGKSKNNYSDEEMGSQEEINIEQMVDKYNDIADRRNLTETEVEFVIVFDINTEKATALEIESMQKTPSSKSETSIESHEVKKMTVEMTLDKKTLFLKTVKTNKEFLYDMEFDGETGTMSVTEDTVTIYKNQNNVDEIKVPETVIQQAKEL